MQLRPYQDDVVNRARDCYRQGYHAPCVVLPCRSGKSCIAADIARKATHKGNRVLFIVHRIELCNQITKTFTKWGVDMSLCDVMMVETACNRLDELPNYDFIITDENHHAPCETYMKIYEHYPKALRLGLTATPWRLDGKGLVDTNDIIIEGVSVQWLLDNKYLSPYIYYAPAVLVESEKLHTRAGDYKQNEVIEQLDKPHIYGDVIQKYKEYADGKKAIAYCASIEHSKAVRDAFRAVGIPAEHVDGTTPKDERERIMDAFRDGSCQVLCNYEIIAEGLDVPDCECCILLRPTQSLTLHIQSSMRCLNYMEGKTAVILDMVGNFERHGLPNTPHEWSLEGTEKTTSAKDKPEVVARQCGNCYQVYAGISPICPYCGFNNGKTKKQIEMDRKAELAEIEAVSLAEKKSKRMEVGQCRTKAELERIAKERGYKPGWVWQQMKIKGIKH